ncbi:MAG: (Fe-S)-binding protein [Candidatus Hodarchaeota archaeon]
MQTIESSTKLARDLVQGCFQCGVCSGACPKSHVQPEFLPRRLVLDVVGGKKDRLLNSGIVWECLTCGLCHSLCPMHLGLMGFIRDLRCEMVEKGVHCVPAHENVVGPYTAILADSRSRPRRRHLFKDDLRIAPSENHDILYFSGCLPYYAVEFSPDVGFEGMNIAYNTVRLLNAIDIEPAIFDSEKCCGHDALWRGEKQQFISLMNQNLDYLTKYDKIVVSCSECLRTFSKDYEEFGGTSLKVEYIGTLLADQLDRFSIPVKDDSELITFHDSCRLGRHMGIYEEPREVLTHFGFKLKEMASSREESHCCGVTAFIQCDELNKKIRRERMTEAVDTGAHRLVTPCPKCQIHLKCLQNDRSEPQKYEIEIIDFVSLLAERLPEEGEAE